MLEFQAKALISLCILPSILLIFAQQPSVHYSSQMTAGALCLMLEHYVNDKTQGLFSPQIP